jgi:hypothetical protein
VGRGFADDLAADRRPASRRRLLVDPEQSLVTVSLRAGRRGLAHELTTD